MSALQNGTLSAEPIRASGQTQRANRPDTRPLLTKHPSRKKSCFAGAIHTEQSRHSPHLQSGQIRMSAKEQKANFAKSRYGIKTDAYRCLGCSRIDSQKRSLIFCAAYPRRLRIWIAEIRRHLNLLGSKPDRLDFSVTLPCIKACIVRTRSPYTQGLRFSFSTCCLPNSAFSLSIQTDHAESPQ